MLRTEGYKINVHLSKDQLLFIDFWGTTGHKMLQLWLHDYEIQSIPLVACPMYIICPWEGADNNLGTIWREEM